MVEHSQPGTRDGLGKGGVSYGHVAALGAVNQEQVMVRKWRGKVGTCLKPDQRPKLRPPVRIRGGPRLNVVAYAGVFGEGHRHALLASILTPPPERALRETSM